MTCRDSSEEFRVLQGPVFSFEWGTCLFQDLTHIEHHRYPDQGCQVLKTPQTAGGPGISGDLRCEEVLNPLKLYLITKGSFWLTLQASLSTRATMEFLKSVAAVRGRLVTSVMLRRPSGHISFNTGLVL